jgi:phosphate transport system permease protein
MTEKALSGKYMIDKTIKFRLIKQKIMFSLFKSAALLNGLVVVVVIYFIASNGLKAISLGFLTEMPLDSMTKGGILPCIIGTLCLSIGAVVFALPVGIATAIYLNEYARPGKLVDFIRFAISNLAGVPSIVFGLFGLAFFCILMNMGVSILAGSLTLAVMSLPVIIGSSEEALRAVPKTYREASLGIGATQWQTTYRVVLPAALPGILTGTILALSRAAGETAPIMFTGAVFFTPEMPSSIMSEVMALPYHIYVLATAGLNIEQTRPMQYGTALVLIVLVLGMNLFAIILRQRLRKKLNI